MYSSQLVTSIIAHRIWRGKEDDKVYRGELPTVL